MSTANKLTYLNETKSKIKQAINIAGANITNEPFRVYSTKLYQQYLDIIKNGTSSLYSAMPKVPGTGTELSLKNTAEAPMVLELSASESTQDTLLPSEYQQVEYIQSSGTQYINTNFVPNQDTKTTIKFAIFNDTNFPVNRSIFGVRQDYDQNHYGMTISQGTNKYLYSGYAGYSTSTGIILEDEKQYELIKDKNVAFLDENQIIIQAYDNFTCPKSMYLFAMNQNGSTFFQASIKMYYCKIYDNDTLVRDFIPCYRKSDDEIGLYDLVNNVFYTNAGTGTFTKGEDVASPNLDYPQNINVVTGNNSITIEDEDNTLSQTFPLSLGSFELAGIGDYKDKIFNNIPSNPLYDSSLVEGGWYKYKRIYKYIVTGEEAFSNEFGENLFTSQNLFGSNPFLIGRGMCNYYRYNSNQSGVNRATVNGEFVLQKSYLSSQVWYNLFFKNTNYSNANVFKTNLQQLYAEDKPVVIYFPLETPIYEQITDTTLISQLEAIKNAVSYDDETNISQTNANRPFVISASAIKNSME